MKTSYDVVIAQVKKVIDDTDAKVNSMLINATINGTTRASQFSSSFTADISLYPCCRSYQEQALNLQDDFTDDLLTCNAASDSSTTNAAFIAASAVADFGDSCNDLKDKADACIAMRCDSTLCLNSIILAPMQSSICTCIGLVEGQARTATAAIQTKANQTLQTINANSASAIAAAGSCFDRAFQNMNNKITQITADYAKCKVTSFTSSCVVITTSKFVEEVHNVKTNDKIILKQQRRQQVSL
jgi:hypothetical protein